MCTVTFLPLSDSDFILTSSRDEQPNRKTFFPKEYSEEDVKLVFPKDEFAGGTWIGMSEKQRLACLLNGAFEKHSRKDAYRMSRGIVVKNILKADDLETYVENFDFHDIEPFTLIIVDWSSERKAFELVWDGETKYFSKLKDTPRIWSSATLYTEEMKEDRKTWFENWLKENPEFTQESILNFHHRKDLGQKGTSIFMYRPYVETVSITSVVKNEDEVSMLYEDVIHEEKEEINL
ncbi:NRDE family protein [Aureivirga marina]|uniref:NRDE family protein n=1 Tax=Aureivirga marina TaxID=1182451 RepID=UPI0018CB0F26|nr:NRDE family protein [Aureivirga marina]